MSKRDGNTIDVADLLAKHGADVCRWWVSSLQYENDIKMDVEFFDLAGETYRKVRNTLRFLLSNLSGYRPPAEAAVFDTSAIEPTSLHAFVLGRAVTIQEQVLDAFETYAFRRAHQLLYDFCNETLSAFYCAAVKDRLYCDRPDSEGRRVTQAVMWELTEILCRLLAPFLPHTADEAYRALCSLGADEDAPDIPQTVCVHLLTFRALPAVTVDPRWPAVLVVRDAALKALEAAKSRGIENPLDAEVVLRDADGTLAAFETDLADALGVSRVQLVADGDVIAINDLRQQPKCDRCWRRVVSCALRDDGGTLCDRCAEAVGG